MQKTLINQALRAPLLHGELVGDHGDELPIGGLILLGGHFAAEGLVQGVDAAAAPGYLDGVADGALHFACGGVEALADAGGRKTGLIGMKKRC